MPYLLEQEEFVLMDLKMPGIDGYTATRLIREHNKNVIIIAQTAYAFADDQDKAIQAGCNGYITKPIKVKELFDLLQSFIKNWKINT